MHHIENPVAIRVGFLIRDDSILDIYFHKKNGMQKIEHLSRRRNDLAGSQLRFPTSKIATFPEVTATGD